MSESTCVSFRLASFTLFLALATLLGSSTVFAGSKTHRFPNGFRLSLVPSAGSGMTASVLVVPCGVRDETASLSGAAHMMEHLMFNGTSRRNQKELYEAIDELGAYVNAATREDHTCYLTLVPAERFEGGARLQAEMLLQSTLPAEKLEKERGVVLQELAKDRQRAAFWEEGAHRRHLFLGTPYQRETLGNPVTIRAMPRAALLDYHRRLYRPARMRAYVFGQFDEKAVLKLYGELYGRDRALAPHEGSRPLVASATPIASSRTRMASARGTASRLFLTYPLSLPPSSSWVAAQVLAARLGQGRDNPLQGWARRHGATGVSASTRFNRDFAFFDVTATLPGDTKLEPVLDSLRRFLREEGMRPVDGAWLRRHGRRVAADDLFLSENMHYYAFMRASMLANASLEALAAERQTMERIRPSELAAEAKRIFESPFVATLLQGRPLPTVSPAKGRSGPRGGMLAMKGMASMGGHAAPKGMAAMRGKAAPKGMAAMRGKAAPKVGTGEDRRAARSEVVSVGSKGRLAVETLPSGMELVLVSVDGPPILAAHLLVRGRAAVETREGALAVAHRCMARRARDLSPEALQARLDDLGARLKFHDDDRIPFDDYYSVPDFAFLRFEALETEGAEAMKLFARLAFHPDFRQEDLDEIRAELERGGMGMGPSAASRARGEVDRLLYGSGIMTARVLPSPQGLKNLTVADLRASHERAYQPRNLILTVVANRSVDALRSLVRHAVEGLPTSGGAPWSPPRFSPTVEARRVETAVRKDERGYVVLERLFDCPEGDRAALEVLAAILSERLAFEIRERRGLAYGVGASVRWLWGQAMVSLRFATRPDAVGEAVAVARQIVKAVAEGDVDEVSCRRAAEKLLGRRRMRLLPRINRAFRMSWNRHHGLAPQAHETLDAELLRVGSDAVKALAARTLKGPWVEGLAR